MNNYLTYSKNLLFKENKPVSLVYFITSNCNFSCRHCFFSESINKQDEELTFEEIEAFSKSMGKFISLSLTGGEPFLRKDIVEIAQLFYKNNHIRNLNIPTNGFLSDDVISGVGRILSNCPDLALNLAVSLDGFSEIHDKIRNRNGSFNKALQTIMAGREMKKSHSNLSLEIITVLSAHNQNYLDKFYDFVINELNPDSINLSPIRGDVKDKSLKNYDVSIYERNIKRIQKAFLKQKISGYANFPFSEYVFAIRMIAPGIILRILKRNSYQIECYAGKLSGVIYSNGDVYPCELLNMKMGNLRDYNFDFKKLWESKHSQNVRDYIKKTKCFCIHPCNFTVNILFNLKFFPYLVFYGIWLKLMRIAKRI